MIFNRYVRTVGEKPSIKLISRENPNKVAMIDGEIATSNAKASDVFFAFALSFC